MKHKPLFLGLAAAAAVGWGYPAAAGPAQSASSPGASHLDARESKLVMLKLPAMV